MGQQWKYPTGIQQRDRGWSWRFRRFTAQTRTFKPVGHMKSFVNGHSSRKRRELRGHQHAEWVQRRESNKDLGDFCIWKRKVVQ